MKTKGVLILALSTAVVLVILFLMLGNRRYASQHPSLNIEAEWPDIHLKHVNYYSEDHRYNRSIFHLDKAISAIRKIESDVDYESGRLLENAVSKLEDIHKELVFDSLKKKDLYDAFDLTLNTLARAELKVSEMYAETNQTDLARLAMKHAQLHLKNALLFENSMWYGDSMHVAVDQRLYDQLDSLIENESISPIELTLKIDDLIKEIDQLVK